MSPETKEKISKAKLGMPSHRKGLTGLEAFTAESLQKMSENSGMKKSISVYSGLLILTTRSCFTV
jgi:hypothetical protein